MEPLGKKDNSMNRALQPSHDMIVLVSTCNKFTPWKMSINKFKTYSILLCGYVLTFMLLSQALSVTILSSTP